MFVFCVMCGCLFLNFLFSSYTFSLTVIIATGNQLDGLSLLEACQMELSYDTGIVYLLWWIKFSLSLYINYSRHNYYIFKKTCWQHMNWTEIQFWILAFHRQRLHRTGSSSRTALCKLQCELPHRNRERKCAENYNQWQTKFIFNCNQHFTNIANHRSFRVLFDEIASVY